MLPTRMSRPAKRCLSLSFLLTALPACGDAGGGGDLGGSETGSETDGAGLEAEIRDGATVVHLDVSDAQGNPVRDFTLHHPLTVTIGLTPDEHLSSDDVYFGLVETTRAGDDHSTKHSCMLGHLQADFIPEAFEDDGSMRFQREVIVPDDCLPEDAASRTFNLWVSINPALTDVHDEDGVSDDDYNTQFFTEETLDLDGKNRNASCTDRNGVSGCAFEITVHESPGLDVQLESIDLEGVVVPVSATCESDFGFADLESKLTMKVFGASSHDGESESHEQENILPNEGQITFQICPRDLESDDGDCIAGTTYESLGITGHEASVSGDQNVTAPHATIDTMVRGAPHVEAHDLHFEHNADLCQSLMGVEGASKDWSTHHVFNVRACVAVDEVDESGHCDLSGECHPTHHEVNNCYTEAVRIVRDFDAGTSSATSHAANYSFDKHSGNSVVNVSFNAHTNNLLNLDGATTQNGARLSVGGWASFDVFNLWANGAAYVSIVDSGYDVGCKLFGSKMWGKSQTIESYDYVDEKTFSKQACARYTYGVAGIGLNASLCAQGSAGIKGEVTIDAKNGNGAAPFDAATKIGEAGATVTPNGSISMVATASLNAAVAKGALTGSLTIIGVDVPLSGTLNWGLVDDEGSPALAVTNNVGANLNISLLKGNIGYWVKLIKPAWCSCGSWCPGYPCSSWSTVASGTLLSISGYFLKQTLFQQSVTDPIILKG